MKNPESDSLPPNNLPREYIRSALLSIQSVFMKDEINSDSSMDFTKKRIWVKEGATYNGMLMISENSFNFLFTKMVINNESYLQTTYYFAPNLPGQLQVIDMVMDAKEAKELFLDTNSRKELADDIINGVIGNNYFATEQDRLNFLNDINSFNSCDEVIL